LLQPAFLERAARGKRLHTPQPIVRRPDRPELRHRLDTSKRAQLVVRNIEPTELCVPAEVVDALQLIERQVQVAQVSHLRNKSHLMHILIGERQLSQPLHILEPSGVRNLLLCHAHSFTAVLVKAGPTLPSALRMHRCC
jgi:hypothetical protein